MTSPKNGGVTYADVRAAVQILIDRGHLLEDITLRMVRDVLGDTGGLGTISKHLATIRRQVDERENADIGPADVEIIVQTVAGLVATRAARIADDAQKEVNGHRQAAERAAAALADAQEMIIGLEIEVYDLNEQLGNRDIGDDVERMEIANLRGQIEALEAALSRFAPPMAKENVDVDNAHTAAEGNIADRPSREFIEADGFWASESEASDANQFASGEDQPPMVETDLLIGGQVKMPPGTSDVADKSDVGGGQSG